MTGADQVRQLRFTLAVAGRPCRPGDPSGDRYVVHPAVIDGADDILIAGIDGSGHGPVAARAAALAQTAVREHPDEAPATLLRLCHARLAGSRGAAMTIARFQVRQRRLVWAGVGNVEAVLADANPTATRARIRLPIPGGVIGYQIPKVHEAWQVFPEAGVLVMATDGIGAGFPADVDARRAPAALAEALLVQHGRPTDDALVVVMGWREAA